MINGQGPFRFAVDSGAAGMMRITSALQKQLQLDEIGQAMTGDPSGKNMTRRPVVRAGRVEIGGARFTGVDAVVGEALGGDELGGVIGLPLFATLTATLDYPRQELWLGRQPLDAHAAHVISFRTEHGIPVIDLDVAGIAIAVHVDTGSPAVLSVPPAVAAKLSFTGAPAVAGKGRTTANTFEIRAADLRGELRIAGFTQAGPQVDIVDVCSRSPTSALSSCGSTPSRSIWRTSGWCWRARLAAAWPAPAGRCLGRPDRGQAGQLG